MDRIFVLAGTFAQSEYWRKRKHYFKLVWRYLNDPRQLAGAQGAKFCRIGTWYERKDLDPIVQQLTICGAVEVTP